MPTSSIALPARIGVDGYNIALPHGTGVATYGRVLAQTLREAGCAVEGLFGIDAGREADFREVLFFDRFGRKPEKGSKEARIARRAAAAFLREPFARRPGDVPLSGLVEARQLAGRMPRFDRLSTAAYLFEVADARYTATGGFTTVRMPDPPDVMHWTYPLPLKLAGARNVYTLHDLVPLRLPFATLDLKKRYDRLLRDCIRHADRIATVSESSAQDILRRYDAPAGKVVNTYQSAPGEMDAVDERFDATALASHGLERDGYFLFVGAIEPKKNLSRIIGAHLGRKTRTPLIIVGADGWLSKSELRLLPKRLGGSATLESAGASPVTRLGYVPRAELDALMRGAKGVMFPSLYEGFGLPVLEAMRAGAPVLTSNTSSLPEVAGEAALLVDPYDDGAIARAMERLDTDAELRDRLRAVGREQAQRFTRERYAERLAQLYAF